MEVVVQRFYEKYAQTKLNIKRDALNEIDWNNRLIGIRGSRGVGKTTLLLQYLKSNFKPNNEVLYASLDNIYFADNRLYFFTDDFVKRGGKLLVLDEVHRYPNWAQEIKNIYDDFPSLKIIFTGSSLLQLSKAKADLSRRAFMYYLPGLSFREFLYFEGITGLPKITFSDLIENHVEIAMDICSKIKPLVYFPNYLSHGYYPYYLENIKSFHQKLQETIQVVLEIDIPQYEQINTSSIFLLKKLLQVIAGSVPFKPNMSSISQRIGISINTLKQFTKYLEEANLISMLHSQEKGINSLNKPEKIFLQNTNLMHTLTSGHIDIGHIRETFLMSQINHLHKVNSSPHADFLVDNMYTLEVGGINKSKKQIFGIPYAYVVKDNMEIGSSNTIPLWLFGFLQ